MIQPIFIVAFSGHRPQSGTPGRNTEDLTSSATRIREALTTFRAKAAECDGTIQVLTSAASGADLIFCQVASELELPIHIILPCSEEEFLEKHRGTTEELQQAKDFIAAARDPQQPGTFRVADASATEPDYYADANAQMIQSADALVTVWNRQDENGKGGTESTWRDAKNRKLPRININPATLDKDPEEHDLSRLIDPENLNSGIENLNHLSDEGHCSLDDESHSGDLLHNAYQFLDETAEELASKTRKNLKYTIRLHGAASFLAALGISYALAHGPGYKMALFWVGALEFILIAAAEWLHWRQHARHRGKRWLRCRLAAELVRPLQHIKSHLDPLLPLIQNHHPDWRRFITSLLLKKTPQPCANWEQSKEDYRTNRLEKQILYFSDKRDAAQPIFKITSFAIRGFSLGALVVVLIAVLAKGSGLHWDVFQNPGGSIQHSNHLSWISMFLYFLPVALPLLAGILLSTRQSFDTGRRTFRYDHMVKILKNCEKDLDAVKSSHALRLVVTQTEEILLNELIESQIAQAIGLKH